MRKNAILYIVITLTLLTNVTFANEPQYWPCLDREVPWSEACYTITSINDFPPPIRMDGHNNIPRIALTWVEVSAEAGEMLLENSSYIYYFPIEANEISECPNGGLETIGVLGNFGSNGKFIPDYPSGIGISKIECFN